MKTLQSIRAVSLCTVGALVLVGCSDATAELLRQSEVEQLLVSESDLYFEPETWGTETLDAQWADEGREYWSLFAGMNVDVEDLAQRLEDQQVASSDECLSELSALNANTRLRHDLMRDPRAGAAVWSTGGRHHFLEDEIETFILSADGESAVTAHFEDLEACDGEVWELEDETLTWTFVNEHGFTGLSLEHHAGEVDHHFYAMAVSDHGHNTVGVSLARAYTVYEASESERVYNGVPLTASIDGDLSDLLEAQRDALRSGLD